MIGPLKNTILFKHDRDREWFLVRMAKGSVENKIFMEKHLYFRVEMDGNDVCQIPVRVRSALWEFDKGKG